MCKWSVDSESVRSKNLLLGSNGISCDRQVSMAMTSAVKMEARLRTRWVTIAPSRTVREAECVFGVFVQEKSKVL